MTPRDKDICVGDLIMVDFDYRICDHGHIENNVYMVVDQSDTCYFIMGMGKPVRGVSKKKCRPYRDIYVPRTVDEFKS